MLFLLLFAFPSFASWDSVAVFHRPDKVIVLINEDATQAMESSRLQKFMGLFERAGSVRFLSRSGEIKITCGHDQRTAGCTFRFFPGAQVKVAGKSVEGELAIQELEDLGLNAQKAEGFDISFLNSNGDQFRLYIFGGKIFFLGHKK